MDDYKDYDRAIKIQTLAVLRQARAYIQTDARNLKYPWAIKLVQEIDIVLELPGNNE